jgi:hypothetical protein
LMIDAVDTVFVSDNGVLYDVSATGNHRTHSPCGDLSMQ